MMAKPKRPIVWVIMHYEIMFDDHIDCLQFHVSSTRKMAETYIHKPFNGRRREVRWDDGLNLY